MKRRHVYKVAAVYAVVVWVVLQIAATALPYLMDRPDPVIRIVIILSLIGLPVALVLGWVFDVTPEGVQRTEARRSLVLDIELSAADAPGTVRHATGVLPTAGLREAMAGLVEQLVEPSGGNP
ncbi:MAG TPA: hypothetical protein VJ957_03730 [Longimicrobiales bacterium]|nr:hypothetical protein [Longimicrobiales bacterium]